jgi:hypothetical protein
LSRHGERVACRVRTMQMHAHVHMHTCMRTERLCRKEARASAMRSRRQPPPESGSKSCTHAPSEQSSAFRCTLRALPINKDQTRSVCAIMSNQARTGLLMHVAGAGHNDLLAGVRVEVPLQLLRCRRAEALHAVLAAAACSSWQLDVDCIPICGVVHLASRHRHLSRSRHRWRR